MSSEPRPPPWPNTPRRRVESREQTDGGDVVRLSCGHVVIDHDGSGDELACPDCGKAEERRARTLDALARFHEKARREFR